MRLSQSLFVTTREVPEGAELRSHQLLLQAGFVRRVGPGLYVQLPLMQRVLRKMEALVRHEMQALGAQEVAWPDLQPAELWQASGRWGAYRAESLLFTLEDRAGRALVLAPTHEEVAAALARDLLRSHRQLPQVVYQVGRKFRDERRPRALLLRAREFVMKDAYSFHANAGSLRGTFEAMSGAYARVLTRLDLPWRMIEADSGAMGGAGSREFTVLTDAGEDEVLGTPDGRYTANAESAEGLPEPAQASPFTHVERRFLPDVRTVDALCAALGCAASAVVQQVPFEATFTVAGGARRVPVRVSVRGDGRVNAAKLAAHLAGRASQFGASGLQSLDVGTDEPQAAGSGQQRVLRLADESVRDLTGFVTGDAEPGWFVLGARWGADLDLPELVDVWQARAGERSRHDPAQRLESRRGVEVAHVFELGPRYAVALGATFAGADGAERPLVMGCYGLGVTRLAQTVAEVHLDARGLNWPAVIAPFEVLVTLTAAHDAQQREVGERLYAELRAAGLDVALDDRDERAGVKLRDAELIGVPWRVTLGRALASGRAEVTERRSGRTVELEVREVAAHLRAQPALSRTAQAGVFP